MSAMSIAEMRKAAQEELDGLRATLDDRRAKRDDLQAEIRQLVADVTQAEQIVRALTPRSER